MRLHHPASPPLRAERRALTCAAAMARFPRSAPILRLILRRVRRAASARHSSERHPAARLVRVVTWIIHWRQYQGRI